MVSITLSRSEVERILSRMDAEGVDRLMQCTNCRQWVAKLSQLPEGFGYSLEWPRCEMCVDRIVSERMDSLARIASRDQDEKAGHYWTDRRLEAWSLYDAGQKSRDVPELPGWVYVGVTRFGSHKIGATRKSVRSRLTCSGAEFVHAIWTDYPFILESALHRRFSEKRTNGEYFKLGVEDIDHIRGIQSVGGRPVCHVTDVAETRRALIDTCNT